MSLKNCSREEQRQCKLEQKKYRKLKSRYQALHKREQQIDPQGRYYQEFQAKKGLLEALGYLQDGKLTIAGEFASQIHGHELLITELFMDGWFHKYSVQELNALAVAIIYETRRNDVKIRHKLNFAPAYNFVFQLAKMEERFLGYSTVTFNDHIALLAYRWSQGEGFSKLMEAAVIDEGDLVFAFRRGIDLLRQVRNATVEDTYLGNKIKECIARMDRDQVSIML